MHTNAVIITSLLIEVNLMCKPTLPVAQVECKISKSAMLIRERVSANDYPHKDIASKLGAAEYTHQRYQSHRNYLDDNFAFVSEILKDASFYHSRDPEMFFMATQRPSWESAPEWANFLTGSLDGFWSWHEVRPTYHNREMFRPCGRMKSVDTGMKNTLWSNSIFERPVLVIA